MVVVVAFDMLLDKCSDGLCFLGNVSVRSGLKQKLAQREVMDRSSFI